MDREWNDSQPIYRQLRDRVVAMILDGVLKEGDPLPSVRTVAADYRVNPEAERQKFLAEDWPRIRETMLRLGLKPEDLLADGASQRQKSKTKKEER